MFLSLTLGLQLFSLPLQTPKLKVALLPAVDMTGEKWHDLMDKEEKSISDYLTDQFSHRGFFVILSGDVKQAITDSKDDFTDEEQQKRETLYDLGQKLNADYIFLPVIERTDQSQKQRLLYVDREGNTDVKVWFLDVKNKKAILSAKTFQGRSGGNRVGDGKGSNRQVQAAANAVRDALKDFFSSFPYEK